MKAETEKQYITNEDETKLKQNLEELIQKLGVLDLREFIAINRFIIEGEQHDEIINKIKSKFLTIAMERMNETKAQDIKKIFKVNQLIKLEN